MIFGFGSGHGEEHLDFRLFLQSIPNLDVSFWGWDDPVYNAIRKRTKILSPGMADSDRIVLIGHSFGGNKAYSVAHALLVDSPVIGVEHLILLDPVHYMFGGHGKYQIPQNVLKADCFWNPDNESDNLPFADPHQIENECERYVNHSCLDAHGEFLSDPGIAQSIRELLV